MTDIVAELRKLYDAAPPGRWEYYERGAAALGFDIDTVDEDTEIGVGIRGMFADESVPALIVAMHEALPRLLDAVEAERNFIQFLNSDESESPASLSDPEWWIEHNRLIGARDKALAALDRSGE